MFNNILRSLSKPFEKGPTQNGSPGFPAEGPDRTEDGFLLVGDTASERTIVRADRFNSAQIDAPPCYGDASLFQAPKDQALPSYNQYRSNQNAYSPTIDVSRHPEIPRGNPMQTGAPTIHTGNSHYTGSSENQTESVNSSSITAITDIPFHLGCSVGSNLIIQEIKRSNMLHQRTFDFSKYDYDFGTEMNCLKDHEGAYYMDTSD